MSWKLEVDGERFDVKGEDVEEMIATGEVFHPLTGSRIYKYTLHPPAEFTPIDAPNLGSDFDPGAPLDPNAVPCPCCDDDEHDEAEGCTCVEGCPNS